MIIGKEIKTKKNITIHLPKLISTRLLIQANSGGGKSWLIRRLLEQTYGKVQQIVIDLEGEFSTLRDKYDYLLVGKDGEITGYSHGSGGFNNAISKLNSLGLIEKDNSHIKLNQELLEV